MSMEVFNELIALTGWGSTQNAGGVTICAGVNVGMAVNTGDATVGVISGDSVWLVAGIEVGGTAVGCGGGEAVAGAHAVNRIKPIHRINFLFMNVST